MTVKEIVEQWLKKNGYDGLYLDDECGCIFEYDDFMPCDEPRPDCSAGYVTKGKLGDEFDFIVGPHKKNGEMS